MTGSSWDVPNGNDYKVIDTAISRFEKLYPNVEVVYESGISKDDYSDWLTDQIVAGTQPDCFLSCQKMTLTSCHQQAYLPS